MEEHFYRGKLPHIQPPEGTFFITYNLYGSIPKPVIQQLRDAYEESMRNTAESLLREAEAEWEFDGTAWNDSDFDAALKRLPDDIRRKIESILRKKRYEEQQRYFEKFDDFLDSNLNEPHWLKEPDIAKLNAGALHFYEGKHYTLWAYCIMANHIHALLTLLPGAPILWKVMQNIKKYTGKEANKILGRHGQFWEDESYDHWVRAVEGEFSRILLYVLNNPVKAGLVQKWEEYPWTYCHEELK